MSQINTRNVKIPEITASRNVLARSDHTQHQHRPTILLLNCRRQLMTVLPLILYHCQTLCICIPVWVTDKTTQTNSFCVNVHLTLVCITEVDYIHTYIHTMYSIIAHCARSVSIIKMHAVVCLVKRTVQRTIVCLVFPLRLQWPRTDVVFLPHLG